ncbi:MAG: hypothetical protein LBJ64_04280, partial [Deltaproteobacteria bacterium]|nr:hypothetical protein [Deltaproteobacteria bacterium]
MTRSASKQFNIYGPCLPEKHYALPVLPRLPEAETLIDDGSCFFLDAPGQSGITTFLLALTDKINSKGNMYALYCSLEALEGIDNRTEGINEIASQIFDSIE